jgi:thiol-disulfide isomerase/thioredoxin
MLLPLILAIRMNVTNENQPQFIERSKELPTFALFYSHHCGHCLHVYPTWQELAEKYANDTKILIAECDCPTSMQACDATTRVQRYPTFVVILRGELMQIRPDRTIEAFSEIADYIRTFDLPCRPFLNQSDPYPYALFSFDSDQATACTQLLSFIGQIPPDLAGRIYLARERGNETRVTIVADRDVLLNYSGPTDTESLKTYVADALQPTYEAIALEQSTRITVRRFGFAILGTNPHNWRYARDFAMANQQTLFVDLINLSMLLEAIPDLPVNQTDLPLLGILSRDHSRLMILRNVSFYGQKFRANVTDILSADTVPEMKFVWPFQPSRDDAPGEVIPDDGQDDDQGAEAETVKEGWGMWGVIGTGVVVGVVLKLVLECLLKRAPRSLRKGFGGLRIGRLVAFLNPNAKDNLSQE